ncbi:putative Cutinase [Seiridium cardinale]|uniref:Cutinase n=1 Tax=Seiridium cardinale TaxID=138064 RepID=A0ABR2Y5S5_9PEZI
MGTVVGPHISNGLKANFGSSNVATESVNNTALLETNFIPGEADLAGIALMAQRLRRAATECPDAKIWLVVTVKVRS